VIYRQASLILGNFDHRDSLNLGGPAGRVIPHVELDDPQATRYCAAELRETRDDLVAGGDIGQGVDHNLLF
jgi:hypothetical protein